MKEYSVSQLHSLLNNKQITSLQLVNNYLERIKMYDGYLHSIGEIHPNIKELAQQMDEERSESNKSPLYGIPIILKDNINTLYPLHTTAGSKALKDNYAPYPATITQKLMDAGMLILGKANMSEYAYFMSSKAPSGFSSCFGQCKSPYSPNIDPLGSSTGSAVAVASNLIPVAIGTETNGSLMSPGYANSIVAFKPTLGMVSRFGILPITPSQDTAGPMGRCVEDIAYVMDAIYGKDENDSETLPAPKDQYQFVEATQQPVSAMRIGLLDFANRLNADMEKDHPGVLNALEQAKQILIQHGAEVIDVMVESKYVREDGPRLTYEFKPAINAYLKTLKDNTNCKTLSQIIQYYHDNPDDMPYGIDILEKADSLSGTLTEQEYIDAYRITVEKSNQLAAVMDQYKLDGLFYINVTSLTAIAGLPTLTVPAKALIDDDPLSVTFTARKWDDEKVFTMASCYEKDSHHRIAPNLDILISK